MASTSPSVDALSSEERSVIVKALALLRASELRASRTADADFKPLYERVIARIDALASKFR